MRYVSVLQDYTTFMTSKNTDYNVYDEMEMVCKSIRYCLFKIITLQKIKKQGGKSQIRTFLRIKESKIF